MRKKFLIRLALLLILLLDIYFILGSLLHTDLLPGPDSPFYLYHVTELSKNGETSQFPFRDRILTILEPVVIAQILGASPLWGIRIFLVGISLTMLLGLFLLTRKIGGEVLALFVVFLTLLSGSFARFFWDLYANAFALAVVPFIIYLLFPVSKLRQKEFFLAATLTGALFLIHNLTAFGFTFLVLPLFLFTVLLFYLRLKEWFKFFLYGGIFALIVFLLGSGFLVPFLPSFLNLETTNQVFIPFQTPFNKENNLTIIRPIFTLTTKRLFIPAVFGFLIACYLFFKKRKKEFIPLFLWLGGLLLLAFQRTFGFNWEPDRFALMVFQPMVIFVGIFLIFLPRFHLIKRIIGTNKYFWQIGFAGVIFLFLWARLPILGKSAAFGLPLVTNQTEREIAEDLNSQLGPKDVVLVNGIRFYWMRYFLSNTNVIGGEYYITCGKEELIPHYETNNVRTAKVFSGSLNKGEIKEKILNIKSSGKFEKVYLFVFEGDECGHGKNLQGLEFLSKTKEENGYKVYEFTEEKNR